MTLHHDSAALSAPRRARLDGAIAAGGVEAMLLTSPGNVRFATGTWDDAADATGETGGLLAVDGHVIAGAPPVGDPAVVELVLDRLPRRGRLAVDRLGLDALATLERARPHLEVVDAGPLVGRARGPKSPAELAVLHQGSLLTERAVSATLPRVTPGTTERDATAAFLAEAAAVGLTEPHIDTVWTVVPHSRDAAWWSRPGDWSSRPPYRQLTGDRRLGVGDRLFLDAGFLHHGYATDFGWTFVVGREPTPGERSLARRWTEVADRVTEALAPGATARDLTEAAQRGWTDRVPPWPFGLYVAHGIGFGGVESPFSGTDLGPDAEAAMPVEPGTVVLVEPYVWEEGRGGYRAERCVYVDDGGPVVWTELPVEQLLATG